MDFAAMRLAAGGNPERMREILQLEMRHKHAAKLPDTLRCEAFEFPDSLSGEQSTSDELAEIHASLIEPGERVLDMTCGLGIDTFHIARKAASVTACELKSHVAEAAERNAAALGLDNVTIVNADSVEWLRKHPGSFDTIFIDPARRSADGGRVYALADCQPDVVALLPLLRAHCSRLIVKASPMLDVKKTMSELDNDADIILLGNTSECKELMAILPGNGTISAVTAGAGRMSYTAAEEQAATPVYGLPAVGDTLYEPYPAVMKSGAMKLLAVRHGLTKTAPDTHLYSGAPVADFPGRAYTVEAVVPFDKRGIKAIAAAAKAGAEVAVRNMGGITAAELRTRLKVKEASDARIYGVRSLDGKRHLILCSKPGVSASR
nr:methyltransferase domain-containing protein [Bacteroides sp.]